MPRLMKQRTSEFDSEIRERGIYDVDIEIELKYNKTMLCSIINT